MVRFNEKERRKVYSFCLLGLALRAVLAAIALIALNVTIAIYGLLEAFLPRPLKALQEKRCNFAPF